MVRAQIWSRLKRPGHPEYKQLFRFRNNDHHGAYQPNQRRVAIGNQNVNIGAFLQTLETQFWNRRPGHADPEPKHIFRIFQANVKFPDLIEFIELRTNPLHGRFYATTQTIKTGQTVFEAKLFASVANRTNEPYCLTCHDVHNVFIPCDKCDDVKFCSLKCKSSNKTHKYECLSNFHRELYANQNQLGIKLAIQVVLEALAIFDGNVANLRDFIEGLDVVRTAAQENLHENPQRRPENVNDIQSRFECFMNLCRDPIDSADTSDIRMASTHIMKFAASCKSFSR